MTLNTDAIRAAAALEIRGADWETTPNANAVGWAVQARQLCDHIDALEQDRIRLQARGRLPCCADVEKLVRENQDLRTTVRLDAERIGLDVARKKRAETRAALTTAFADLSTVLAGVFIFDVDARAVRNALHTLHVAVANV